VLKKTFALLTAVFLSAAFYGCGDSNNPLLGGGWKLDVEASEDFLQAAIEMEELTTPMEQSVFRELMKSLTVSYEPDKYSMNTMGMDLEAGKITYSKAEGTSWNICYFPDKKFLTETYCEVCELQGADSMECTDQNELKSHWRRTQT
jgi:hypothetical protein